MRFKIKHKKKLFLFSSVLILILAALALLIFFRKNIKRQIIGERTQMAFVSDDGENLDINVENLESKDGEYTITYYVNGIEEAKIKKKINSLEEFKTEEPKPIKEMLKKAGPGNPMEVKIVIAWDGGREEIIREIKQAPNDQGE